jgi:hypothetical protein
LEEISKEMLKGTIKNSSSMLIDMFDEDFVFRAKSDKIELVEQGLS